MLPWFIPQESTPDKIAVDPYRHDGGGNGIKELTKPSGDKIAIDPMAEFVRQVRR